MIRGSLPFRGAPDLFEAMFDFSTDLSY